MKKGIIAAGGNDNQRLYDNRLIIKKYEKQA